MVEEIRDEMCDDEIIDEAISEWCENNIEKLDLEDWDIGYTHTPSYYLSYSDLFSIVDHILHKLRKSGKYSKHISCCDCDYDEFENEYDEDDITNDKPELMRVLPLPYQPSSQNVTDYENIHIFEIDSNTTPILPETVSEIAVISIDDKIFEWIAKYNENNHDENADSYFDEDECEY